MRRVNTCLLVVCLGAMLWACDDDGSADPGPTPDSGITVITQCNNAIDDDGDDLIDLNDPGCANAQDDDETDEVVPQCRDGEDNDADGLIDLQDPACASTEDDDESDDPPPPQCSNGLDDDADGAIDLEDRGCANANDADESDEPPLPACSNGEDDDQDGFVDFPSDPGCGSDFDDDEGDEGLIVGAQCGNGIDDDNDGLVDLADPGCTSAADPRESDPDERAQCSNGLDDDGDGIVDFPYEPGCSAAGDDDETDPERPPQCGNGLDDDNDGRTDYPEDPGCAGIGDRDETVPDIIPACSDGIDNDRDDLIDYPEDRGCESAADATETGSCGRTYEPAELVPGRIVRGDSRRGEYESEGSCGGRGSPEVVFLYRVERRLESLRIATLAGGTEVETALYVRRGCLDARTEIACNREELNDGVAANALIIEDPSPGDYYIFLDGASGMGGDFELQVEEVELAHCLNGIDDDADGRTDYPADPGCERASDRDEADPDPLPACSDDQDNDGDGLVDYPLDVGCRSAADTDEVDVCGDGIRFFQYPVGEPFIIDSTQNGTNVFQGSCGGANAPEKIFLYENPFNANLTFSLRHEETIDNTLIYVRNGCQGREMACNQSTPRNIMPLITKGEVLIENAPPGDYFVVVDNTFGMGGAFKLSVDVERLPPGCADGRDNDMDGFIDADDLGCADVDDEDESDPAEGEPLPQCWNGEDDDGDGIIDYPFEPGCVGKGDNDEEDPAVIAACANGLDDDEDGLTDFPNDVGCAARGDEDEEDPRVRPRCNNRIDDDNDGLTDYPLDPGCAAAGDPSEANDDIAPACADGEDNDRDGLVDYPFDPGCIAAGHVDEADPDEGFACSNGLDDDGDGIVDFPREPGCAFAADDDEEDPGVLPQCANGNDDDRNGRIDFPDDPGCRFAGDLRELTDGPVPARCSDGVDNDDDGMVDLTDIGCVNARDDDETDPEVAPYCADGADNDADGETDWPDDPGCAAQGDECEQFGFGFCNGECIGLLDNPLNCGVCGRVCAAGVECQEGRCGGLREVVLECGNAGRDIQDFIRGPLVEAEVRVENGCVPDDLTQAILVPRGGIGQFNQNADAIRTWVEGGGVVITEYNISDDVYNTLFRAMVAQGARGGNCNDNIQPAAQFSPNDPFWIDNDFVPIAGQTGCGFTINNFPNAVLLGGWNAEQANLGYVELGAGRVWLVDADWQDGQAITEQSLDLMAYMIANGGSGGGLPPCLDNRDNDEDGFVDAEDVGCDGPADEEEGDPPAGDLPECGDGVDNDDDGIIDFPLEPGCETRGDVDETDPADPPACANGLDDDGDGEPDYPNDPGCASVGDLEERDPLRAAQCGNRRDDDNDGLIDYPADPGCAAAGDFLEDDDQPTFVCANGIDDDRDGITDWPFDVGCASARDGDETDPVDRPQCSNGLDDDEDGLTDFPVDPGCAYNADPREVDPVTRPQCSNGIDDDRDGQTDYPDDRGCFFAADDAELDPFQIPPRCANGVDDDDDGAIDLADPGCVNAEDDDEENFMVERAEAPLCANDIDDDDDGLTDWPADPGCQAQGDDGEAQACADIETIDVPQNGSVMGVTAEDDADNFRNRCGGHDAPDAVYRYVLDQAGPLTISTDNPGTDYPAVLSVRRDCDEPFSQLACVGDFENPEPTISLANAQPGEYFIVVDGGSPERWVGSQAPVIALPADPNNYVANDDINANGWSDAGDDAFDGYGRVVVTHAGQASPQLDVSLQGVGRDGQAGPYGFRYTSELLGNVWRIRILPLVENDERPVTITMTGNLGSDNNTVSAERLVPFRGRQIAYLHTTDNFAAPDDPPVFHVLVPSDPEQLGSINYAIANDNPTLTANDITLPATIYIGLSYNLDFNAVSAGIVSDLEVRAGGGGPDAPRFGNFELSVQEGE